MPQKTPAQGGKGTEGRPPFILIVDDDRSARHPSVRAYSGVSLLPHPHGW